jgi:acyl-CoA thioester hydrolase
MTEVYAVSMHARWPDMDFNGHMGATAYLDHAEDCRMRYFEEHGFSMGEFARLRIGPVVRDDSLQYRRELRLNQRARLSLELAGLSPDASRFRLRNTFHSEESGELVASVSSTVGWLDLDQRRLCVPPAELATLLSKLSHVNDFETLSSCVRA